MTDQIELSTSFFDINTSNTGLLTLEELNEAFLKQGMQIDLADLTQLFSNLTPNPKISYSEYLTATLDLKTHLTFDRLYAIF